MTPYKCPLRAAEAEFTEKKSRFIGQITPVSSEEEALSFLRAVRKNHAQAGHNVYAYRLKTGGLCRHSDDGEPSGTAGTPLLDVFLKGDIFDFCCVATRYYGGIMLGAGGLVRAYSRCGTVALEASGTGTMREVTLCAVTLPYALYENVKRLLVFSGAAVEEEIFGAEIELRFSLLSEDVSALAGRVTELTAGSVIISPICRKNLVQ
jgi:uncharacterized YigZ family protein